MFKVSPEALRAAAHDYTVCAGHMAITARYHREPSRLEFFEHSILALVESRHAEFVELLQRRLEEAAMVLSDSGEGLVGAASMYETSDIDSERELDATYPPIGRKAEAKP